MLLDKVESPKDIKRILRNELRKKWKLKFPHQRLLIDCGGTDSQYLILTPKGTKGRKSKYLYELCASLYL